MRNAAKDFETFRIALFGGYKKEDVLDYIDLLTREMEEQQNEKAEMEQKWKDELEEKTQSVSRLTKMLEEALEKAEEWKKKSEESMSEEEKNDMQTKLDNLKRENDELRKRNEALEEGRKVYEKRSAALSDVLTDARMRADHIVDEAQRQADTAIRQAEESIELQRQAADRVYQSEVGKSIEQLVLVRLKMGEYLDKLDEVHSGIEKIYGSMSQVTAGIPTSVDMIRRLTEKSVDEETNRREKGTEDRVIKRIGKED